MPAIQSSVRKECNLSPVQVGMALSYAVKNAEFKCFALTGDDTPDTEEEDHREPAADTSEFANGAGQEHLRRFEAAQTMDEWKAVNEDIKSKWDTLKHIKGFSEDSNRPERRVLAQLLWERIRARRLHADNRSRAVLHARVATNGRVLRQSEESPKGDAPDVQE